MLATTAEVITWDNASNKQIYQKIPPDILTYLRNRVDPVSQDCQMIAKLAQQADHILELGAGNGRVVDFLLNNSKIKGKLTAVERDHNFAKLLRHCYGRRCQIIESDIFELEAQDQKFDLILSLWSGFCEFNGQEQQELLELLCKMQPEGATLALEMVSTPQDSANVTHTYDHDYVIEYHSQQLHGHVPTCDQLTTMAITAGYQKLSYQQYEVAGHNRIMFWLHK